MDALFVIDMINGFCEKGNLSSPSIKEITPNIINFYNKNKDNIHTAIAFAETLKEECSKKCKTTKILIGNSSMKIHL